MASSSAATDRGHLPPPSSPGLSHSAPDAVGDDDLVAFRRFSRPEALCRRSRRGKQLMGTLKDWYWALMEDVRVRYRDYYWKYGKSPVEDESGGGLGLGSGEGSSDAAKACVFPGCKSKPMVLTTYCSMHILSDPKQTLYKPCTYVVKSAPLGPVTCGKPVLFGAIPSLCHTHFQKAQKHISQALKKAGLSAPSSSKLAPKFHVIVAEYVRQIQARRRYIKRENDIDKVVNVG